MSDSTHHAIIMRADGSTSKLVNGEWIEWEPRKPLVEDNTAEIFERLDAAKDAIVMKAVGTKDIGVTDDDAR